jgi:DNA invertase Pin-like site-specific DNA recombinase
VYATILLEGFKWLKRRLQRKREKASSKRTKLERQTRALLEKGVDSENLFIDKQSGKNADREQLKALLAFCRKGDVVITESISRIARNTKDLLTIVETLTSKGVDFVSLKESIDTSTPQGKFMLTVFGAMAELERESILERQKEGIAIAKEAGLYKGKQKKKIDRERFEAVVKEWRADTITAVEAMKKLDLKPNTFYRRVKERGL